MEYAPDDALRLHIVRDAIRRRWLLVVLVALALSASAVVLTADRTTEYTAAARTLLRPIPGNALSADSTQSSQQITIAMETEAQLVTSPGVVKLVNEEAGTSLEPGTDKVHATVPANTEIIRIEYTADTPEEAQTGAQAFADSFLAYREQETKDTQQRQIDTLQDQLDEAQADLRKASKAAASVAPPPGSSTRVQLYAGRVATLQDAIGNASATDTQPGSVVTPASLPQSPAGLSRIVIIGAAGLVGIVIGLVLTIWLERRDDRIRVAGGAFVAGVPVLADLSHTRQQGPRLITQRDSDDPVREAFRLARAGLLATTDSPAIVVVSGLSAQVDVSLVATNLGLSLVAAGYDVTLVDATVDGEKVAPLLKIETAPGVAELLGDRRYESHQPTKTHGLKVVPAGKDPVGSREHYAGGRLPNLLGRLRRRTDFVIVAAPPHGTAEGSAAAAGSDGVLLVLADREDTHARLLATVDRARQTQTRIIGAITLPSGGTLPSATPSPVAGAGMATAKTDRGSGSGEPDSKQREIHDPAEHQDDVKDEDQSRERPDRSEADADRAEADTVSARDS